MCVCSIPISSVDFGARCWSLSVSCHSSFSFEECCHTCLKLWQNDIQRNKAGLTLLWSFSCCLPAISDFVIAVVEYSSSGLTMGFEVRLELFSPVMTFHFMSPPLFKKNNMYGSQTVLTSFQKEE